MLTFGNMPFTSLIWIKKIVLAFYPKNNKHIVKEWVA